MADKKTRNIKVCRQPGYDRKPTPEIQGHDRYQIEVREGGAGSGRKEAGRAKGKAR